MMESGVIGAMIVMTAVLTVVLVGAVFAWRLHYGDWPI